MFPTILFYAAAATLIGAAIAVITVRNPVHAVLSLILAFVSSAVLWLLLEVEFLARLRDVQAFASINDLKRQLQADVVAAKKIAAGSQ